MRMTSPFYFFLFLVPATKNNQRFMLYILWLGALNIYFRFLSWNPIQLFSSCFLTVCLCDSNLTFIYKKLHNVCSLRISVKAGKYSHHSLKDKSGIKILYNIYIYIYVWIDTALVFFIAFMNTRLDRQLSYKISCLGPSDLLPTTRSTQIKSATADWLVLILWLWKPIRYYFFFFIRLLGFHVSQNYLHFLYSYILLKTYTNV